ncbi:MAG TPA: BON domain-containing protein, partial [Candidatus Angelobacter sp.]|nr:BON domain-containing protein [Candidatus Angelobacter sp.]
AIQKQMPSSADKVSVGITSDNRIQLKGNVDTEQEKQQIEQVAQSAAPDATIVNNISVGNPSPGSHPPLI